VSRQRLYFRLRHVFPLPSFWVHGGSEGGCVSHQRFDCHCMSGVTSAFFWFMGALKEACEP
jgi:hypothetical protein